MPGEPEGPSDLEFRLLGPLEVCRDTRPLRLGGERQRALLALLLIHANTVVSSDRLMDQLFGGELSDSSANALQVAVSRLRRLLDRGAPNPDSSVLISRPPGYVLRAAPDRLDTRRFEQLFEAGRRALADDDPAAAVASLRQALGLWRGPALADLALLDVVRPEIRRLEELRLAALMERIDAELALGAGAELVAELEALASSNPYHERLRGQLMLALYRSGRQADALAVYRQTREFLRDELGIEPSRALQELEGSILRQDQALEPSGQAIQASPPPEEGAVVCPFKGLAYFDLGDAEYFFGRERVIADLVTRLAAARLVGIVGPSGAGKSSLLRAGLMPILAAGVLPGSERWRPVVIRPGEHPMTALRSALGDSLDVTVAGSRASTPAVLAVDQFEEVFTACDDEGERSQFVDALVRAALDQERQVAVLVTLRADFYGRCVAYPGFAGLLSRSHVLVGPMERDELARAIELPAARAGLQVERGLVDALVADVAGQPGGLPLLSTMLLELWPLREGRVMRLQAYRLSGGVRSAVARLAEDTYGRLSADEQRLVRTIMLRLTVGDLATVARRRQPIAAFSHLDGAEGVLATLIDARLVTAGEGEVEVAHEALLHEWPRFRAWLEDDEAGRRLHDHLSASAREWEQRGRDAADLYRGARLAASLDWAGPHQAEMLGVEREFLDAAREQAEREQMQTEREAVRQRKLNRRLRGLLSGTAFLLIMAVAAGVVAFVKQHDAQAASRVALARQLGAEAVVEPRIDLAMLLAREAVNLDRSPQTEGTLLATLARSPAAIGTFAIPMGVRPLRIVLSPDGRTLLVAGNDGSVRFYDTRTRREQRTPLKNFSSDPAPVYSSEGSLLLAPDNGNPPAIQVLDGRTLQVVSRLAFDDRWLNNPTTDNSEESLFLSPDRKTVYYAYSVVANGKPGASYLDRWDLPSGHLISTTQIGAQGLDAVRLLPGGTQLAILTDNAAEYFDAATLTRQRSVDISLPADVGPHITISPDGTQAAYGSRSGAVSFVDLSTGSIRTVAGSHTAGVLAGVYSPDGRTFVTTADDRKVIVWDPKAAQALEVLTGHGGRPLAAAYGPDGQTLYTCALDGVVLEWDLGSARRFGRQVTAGQPLASAGSNDTPYEPPLAVSPDGSAFAVRAAPAMVGIFSTRTLQRTASFGVDPQIGTISALAWSPVAAELAVAGPNGSVQLWDVAGQPRLVRPLAGLQWSSGLPEAVQAVAFSRDGRLVAATDIAHQPGDQLPDGRLAVWQSGSGAQVGRLLDQGAPGVGVAFSPDNRMVATALRDGRVVVSNPSTGWPIRTLRPFQGSNGGAVSVAFAPDGTLATGVWAGIVQLWNPSDGSEVAHPVLVAQAPVAGIAFNAAGDRFATTGGSDGTLKLWFTSTLQQDGASLDDGQGTWGAAAFTPDGQTLVSINDKGRAFLWPAGLTAWENHACAVAGRDMTPEEWKRFIAGRSYSKICG